jgi:D-serine deaminase-like pyridoxal phosphate-dependent protein
MNISEIDTPALAVDLDIMERNLRRVADYSREHGLRLRPHTKTHKSPVIGRRQVALGAVGLTVAKVGEAEVMQAADPPDLLVAYPVLGRAKLNRLMQVAETTRVTVSLDSLVAAQQLSDAARNAMREIGVLAEFDAGLGRVGVSPGPDLLDLARAIQGLKGLRFEGLAFYPGYIKAGGEEARKAIQELSSLVKSIREDFSRAGIRVNIVSGGSTPSLYQSHEVSGLNEVRPGTYVYNDLNTVISGACTLEDCAASVLVTVASTAHAGQVIIDGGSKTFSSDRLNLADNVTFGRVVEAPGCVFHRMNEEHGFVDVTHAGRSFAVGDRLRLIPNHVCVVMNLHECVYGVRGEHVEEIWKVEGRGKLR